MVVGDDITVRCDEKSRSAANLLSLGASLVLSCITKQTAEWIILLIVLFVNWYIFGYDD